MSGIVFDIEEYAVYDGPGIRTCVFFKGCPLHCDWCHNPESQRRSPEMGLWVERCDGCGRCVPACPESALRIDGDVVVRDPDMCRVCGTCVDVCPTDAMEKIGAEMTVAQVLAAVVADRPFFEASGGGVTITGGEATSRPDFLLELLEALRADGLESALETCGHFPAALCRPLASAVDLVLYDIKHVDTERHLEATGVDGRLILANFATLLGLMGAGRLRVRIPVIPDFNTDPESVGAIADHLRSSGYVAPVELMPYRDWSAGKYALIGRADDFRRRRRLEDAECEQIACTYAAAGLEPVWQG